MLLQVHDELVFECPPEEVEAVSRMVKREMEGVYELDVPLVVDVGVGRQLARRRSRGDFARRDASDARQACVRHGCKE